MAHLPALCAASNPAPFSALSDEATDRAERIARRIGSLTFGASAVMDGVRVRRVGLALFELDGATIIDTAGTPAEIAFQAEERLALDEVPITLGGQRIEAERVAVAAAARMLRLGEQGRYELVIDDGCIVTRWEGAGSQERARKVLTGCLAARRLSAAVVGPLVRPSAPAQRGVA